MTLFTPRRLWPRLLRLPGTIPISKYDSLAFHGNVFIRRRYVPPDQHMQEFQECLQVVGASGRILQAITTLNSLLPEGECVCVMAGREAYPALLALGDAPHCRCYRSSGIADTVLTMAVQWLGVARSASSPANVLPKELVEKIGWLICPRPLACIETGLRRNAAAVQWLLVARSTSSTANVLPHELATEIMLLVRPPWLDFHYQPPPPPTFPDFDEGAILLLTGCVCRPKGPVEHRADAGAFHLPEWRASSLSKQIFPQRSRPDRYAH